jgi:mRNA-degrading endonuclease toxin of MazEF toxin-antitoxin module
MKRGDIVLAIFPHASGTPAKRRPALVVQADFYNRKISNVLLAPITSNLARRNDAAYHFIDISMPDGKLSGLTQNSLVSCLNVGVGGGVRGGALWPDGPSPDTPPYSTGQHYSGQKGRAK